MSEKKDTPAGDAYGFGIPLTPEGLFQLTTDEAFRDGKIDEEDNRLLRIIGKHLKLESERARQLARRSREKFQNGEFSKTRPFDGRSLYRRVLGYHLGSSLRDETIRGALELLRKIFKIDEDSHRAIESEVQSRIRDARRTKQDVELSGTMPVRPRHVSLSEALADHKGGSSDSIPLGEGLPVEREGSGPDTEEFYLDSVRWIKEAIEAKKKAKKKKVPPMDLTDV